MSDSKLDLFIVFVITGMILIGAEIYMPGAVLGIVGGIALIIAAILGFAVFGPIGGGYALAGIVIASILMVALWMKFFPGSRMGRKIMVAEDLSASKASGDYRELVGRQGMTVSELRPAGFAMIDNTRVDVVTQGEMISKDVSVEVVKVEGSRVIVREIK